MRRSLRFLLPALALLVALPATASAEKPNEQALYQDGPEGRYLLDGDWLFRRDNDDQGVKQRWMRSTSTSGWTKVLVPNVWNLGDSSNESMTGGIGWYRKDFELPNADSALAWAFRFESVNYRAKVWLNGNPIGENTGAYVPWELQPSGFKRRGTNRLVVRVDSVRRVTDFPPAGLNTDGVPTGGWWNYSGIQREVYLKKLDTVDFRKVLVRPVLPCANCDATIQARINLKNVTGRGQRVTVTGKFGSQNLRLGTKTIGPDGITEFADNITVRNPRLWAPGSPNLYDVSITVRVGDEKVAGYDLKSGIRSIKVSNGRLLLNGQALNTRGARDPRGLQEPGLRDRQRPPRGAAQPGQGARRDLDPHALSVPPVHARAGGPHGHPDLVRDPGLHGQDPGPQGARRAAAGGRGAAPQHRGQREPRRR